MKPRKVAMAVALMAGLGVPALAQAVTVTLDAIDRGWYSPAWGHNANETNYFVGKDANYDGDERLFRNFVVFDLSAVSGPITAAALRLFNPSEPPGFDSADASESYSLFHVETPIDTLRAGTDYDDPATAPIWNDLGEGTLYGSVTATSADNGTFIEVLLNADAVSALNAASGLFAFGGAITTLDLGSISNEYLFAATQGRPLSDTQLVLEAVPLPPAFLLFGSALIGLGFSRRRTH